jgi:CxxC motif-containing protein (DUF1111 family)
MLSWMVCGTALGIASGGMAAEPAAPAATNKAATAVADVGREIFLREWLPNDPRSHGGDGLGPVFNDTSCVSCHNQGGIGGGGAEAKNVIVISAIRVNFNQFLPADVAPPETTGVPFEASPFEADPFGEPRAVPVTPPVPVQQVQRPAAPSRVARVPAQSPATAPVAPAATTGTPESAEAQERKLLLDELRKLHPGLVTARSVVLHKSGTDPKYAAFRDQALGLNAIILTGTGTPMFTPPFFSPDPFDEPTLQAAPAFQQPRASEGGGFFAELAAEAQQSVLRELQPPNELLAERGRSILSRRSHGAGNAQQFFVPARTGSSVARNLAVIPTQRNSIALFGAGRIDAIPDAVIEAAAAKQHEDFPEITGRVARLKDGKIGRFGWKAQKPNLYDFTMTACAVELGLHVPDHPQAGVPNQPDYQPAGFDLNRDECRELVQFLKNLPAPGRTETSNPAVAKEVHLGELAFAKIGCAACHVPDMGEVSGLYSDLLVHDMGSEMGDSGSYGVFQPQSPGNDADDPLSGLLTRSIPPQLRVDQRQVGPFGITTEEAIPDKMIGAGRQEWRTPPLWGVRDSAPYMHDGRAGSLEQAIAFHGGEAQLSANRFYRLPPDERARVLAFLRTLAAPSN